MASSITAKLARLAMQTSLFPVFGAEGGEVASVTKTRRPAPAGEYLRPQRRSAYLFKGGGDAEALAYLQATTGRNIYRYGFINEESLDEDVRVRVLSASEGPKGCCEHTPHVASQTKQGHAEAAASTEAFENRGPATQTRRPNTVMRTSLRTSAPEQE